jgi:6-phosphogluconolactonase
MHVRAFPTPQAMSEAAAGAIAEAVCEAIAARGRCSIALAGGSTPRAAYEALAADPLRARVDWLRTEVFFGDERGVGPDDPDSNYRLARESLLDRVPVPASQVHRVHGERDLAAAAREYEADLARTLGAEAGGAPPAIDLVLLGIGPDGHTASLFPGTAELDDTRRWFVDVRGPKPPFGRVTATLPLLNAARQVFFLVAGAEKAAVLADIVDGSGVDPRPAARVARDRAVVFADAAAAAALAAGRSARS